LQPRCLIQKANCLITLSLKNLGTLTITQTTTVLTWANPAAINLRHSTLGRTTRRDQRRRGWDVCLRASGGNHSSCRCPDSFRDLTPTDGTDYSSAAVTASLTVNKAPLTVTPTPASKVYGTAIHLHGSITGLFAGDTITASYARQQQRRRRSGVYSRRRQCHLGDTRRSG